jgi:hypothetical protein
MEDFEQWIASFTTRKHVDRHKYTIDRIDSEFCIVLDCSVDEDAPELSATTCDILIEPRCESDESVRVVANVDRHGVMAFIGAIGLTRFNERVQSAYHELMRSLLRSDIQPAED